MGLLDDAIREHLELKRRSGADPGEVARQEQAALDPGFAEAHAEPAADAYEPLAESAYAEQPPAAVEHPVPDPGFIAPGEETAEIDMQAVLEADAHEGHQGDPLGGEALHGHGSVAEEEEQFEWETPTRPGEGTLPEQIPGQERLTFE